MKIGNPNDPKRNGSGYSDPTAFAAIMNIEGGPVTIEEYEKFHKLIKSIKIICDLAGFSVAERIVLEDKKTGRVWK